MAASVDRRLHSNAYEKIKHQESQQQPQQQKQQQYIANGHGCVYVESSEEEWESEAEEDSDEWLSSLLPKENAVAADGDPRDAGTADEWVKRHPQMIRLTGRHPFNSEPPLCKLMQSGFLTPVSLHYVRNHGYVPRLQWDTWTVEVCGLVRRPIRLTMDQLCSEFRPRELPVTLVCAGNRRKEQNLVKQTIGFNWGAAGVSNSMWRGARLCDVLRRCGIMSKKKGVKYVCFEGAENLPGGGGSRYGTSISVDIAMDRSRDLILAYRQNGEPLHPDHGFPVRMIIPGFIGGRMVKWLRRIIVSGDESDSHYHYHDNRVLPSHVDAETAKAEDWWHRPEYIINELNINSVITTPSHEEILPINSATSQRPYTLRGYAYSGGGRKIIRVEITLDGGETWKLCRVNHVEKPTKYGKYWCWCFWEQDVEVMELLGTKEVAVRAWDESMNTQPKDLTWNVMGMMNNCWFRVKMQVCKPHQGEIGLVFEHPTRPGNQSGGWMVRDKRNEGLEQQNAGLLKKSSSVPVMNTATRQITMAEVKKHSTPESAWIVVRHHVYDCTRFLKDHPGGSDSILINAGSDCTEEFDAIHSDKAKALLEDFRIGELVSASTGYSSSSCDTSPENSVHGSSRALSALLHSSSLDPINEVAVSRPEIALSNPKQKIRCTLVDKIPTSHDTRIFRFRLPSPDQVLGLPIGKHIFLCAKIRGKLCLRAYTPVSCDDEDVGHFSLLIKVYFKNTHPKFPEGGLMTQYLESLPLGQTVDVKGPLGHIQYTDHGSFAINGEPRRSRKVAMLAGGTGITPLYQIIRAIMRNPDDRTEMFLVYANRTEADILLRAELDAWAADEPARFHVWYVVEQASPNWKYDTGFIREEIMRSHLPLGGPPAHEAIALMCGPPPMIQFACLPNLAKLGYDKDADCFQF